VTLAPGPQVDAYDKGQYECRAENDAGSTSGILTLVVQGSILRNSISAENVVGQIFLS
jgi:hypothetical protein